MKHSRLLTVVRPSRTPCRVDPFWCFVPLAWELEVLIKYSISGEVRFSHLPPKLAYEHKGKCLGPRRGRNRWNWTDYEEMAFEPIKAWKCLSKIRETLQGEQIDELKCGPGDPPLRWVSTPPVHLGNPVRSTLTAYLLKANRFPLRSILVWTLN